MLGNWLRGLFTRKAVPLAVFTEPDMDQWAMEQREEYVEAAMETGLTREEAENRADTWNIHTIQVKSGDNPYQTKYMPLPNWDWDWAWRPSFDTREEAEAHVREKQSPLL